MVRNAVPCLDARGIAMLKVLIGFGAVLIAGTIAIGVDFSVAAKGREGYSLGDHIAARVVQLPGLAETRLAAALPAAPDGWTTRDGKLDDSYLIFGKNPTDEERAILLKLDAEFEELPGYQNVRRFYQRGDKIILADASFIPANARSTKIARFSRGVMATISRRSTLTPVLDLNGLQFMRLTGGEFDMAAFYVAQKDDGLYVSLSTNLDAAEAEALLPAFDAATLLAMLTDDPTIGQPLLGAESAQICVRKGGIRTCQPVTN
jgi:hypothetical protein